MRMLYTESSLMDLSCALSRIHRIPEQTRRAALTELVQTGGSVRYHNGWKYTLGGPSMVKDLNDKRFWLKVESDKH